MSDLYFARWTVPPGAMLEELIPEALDQLPLMLTCDGAELHGKPTWSLRGGVLAMSAPAGPDRGTRPWESREAWIDDMMPDPWIEPPHVVTGTGWPG